MQTKLDKNEGILRKGAHFHFVGIGGAGMSPLAMLLSDMGYAVSGCDLLSEGTLAPLHRRGIAISKGHSCEHLLGIDGLIYSYAAEGTCEVQRARELSIPTYSRAELLGELMRSYDTRIGISGTHGKSTVCAMLDSILRLGGKRPTTVSGAPLSHGESYTKGDLGTFLYEACEYRDAFLHFFPTHAVFLNLEHDHTDYFLTFEDMKRSFREAAKGAACVVYHADDVALASLFSKDPRSVSVGRGEGCRYRYRILSFDHGYARVRLAFLNEEICFTVGAPGRHNAVNAVIAIATAHTLGVPFGTSTAAMESFRGIHRRLELVGCFEGRAVYYDYAHHPTEIAAGIETVRAMCEGEITVVFCPHTYTRTRDLWDGFCGALSLAERVILMPIFAAREESIPGISSESLAAAIGHQAASASSAEDCRNLLCGGVGTILLMGAGDLSAVRRAMNL